MSYADHYSAKTMNRQGKSKDCRWKTALLRVHPCDATRGDELSFSGKVESAIALDDRTCGSNNCSFPCVCGSPACRLSFLGGVSKQFDRAWGESWPKSFSVADIRQFAKLH
jgi:hypothetical protein